MDSSGVGLRLPAIVARNRANRSGKSVASLKSSSRKFQRGASDSTKGERSLTAVAAPPRKNDRTYTYAVLPGNNSRALLSEFRKRPWWNSSHAETACLDISWEMYKNKKQFKDPNFRKTVVNHLYANQCLVSKKGLYRTIVSYCSAQGIDPLDIIPRTFYLSADENEAEDDDFLSFCSYNSGYGREVEGPEVRQEPIWILKPASQTNRGVGIKVARGAEAALDIVQGRRPSAQSQKGDRSAARKRVLAVGWVVQEYMERPLLVSGRNFDIRSFVLVTLDKSHGLRGYYYRDGYVRTSSKAYSLKNLSDRETHLTNDAVQTKSKNYGQFEVGNKINFSTWQEIIDREYPSAPRNAVQDHILPKLVGIIQTSIAAAAESLLAGLGAANIDRSFELLGYDFMVREDDFGPTLIEINSNPCLEYVSPMIENIISSMLSGVFMTAVDPLYPPPKEARRSKMCQSAVESVADQENFFSQIYPPPSYVA